MDISDAVPADRQSTNDPAPPASSAEPSKDAVAVPSTSSLANSPEHDKGTKKKTSAKTPKESSKKQKKKNKKSVPAEEGSSESATNDDVSSSGSDTSSSESSDEDVRRKQKSKRHSNSKKKKTRVAARSHGKKTKSSSKRIPSNTDLSSDTESDSSNDSDDEDDINGGNNGLTQVSMTPRQMQLFHQWKRTNSLSVGNNGSPFYIPPPRPGELGLGTSGDGNLDGNPLFGRRARQPPLPSKNAKRSKLDYRRVDQVWDSSIHNYKLQDTTETISDTQYDGYVLQVRRTFDWEGKYKATFVDIKSKILRECLQDVIGSIKGVSLVDETPKLDPNMLFL